MHLVELVYTIEQNSIIHVSLTFADKNEKH